MSEHAGPTVAALQARQVALASQHGALVEADHALTEVLASVHAALRDGIRRLDAIADEIDRAARGRSGLAVDTAIGAREFQNFLIAKTREIAALIADARELGHAKAVALEGLRAQYSVG